MDKIFEIIDKYPTESMLLIVFLTMMFREEIKQLLKDLVRLKFFRKNADAVKADSTSDSNGGSDLSKQSIPSKMSAYMYAACEDIKTVYIFKSDLVFTEYRSYFEGLTQLVERERKSGRLLVLNLVNIKMINDFAKEVIRDAVFEAIIHNNIRMLIVFPAFNMANTVLRDLYTEFIKKIDEKSPKTIQVKVDDRSEVRI